MESKLEMGPDPTWSELTFDPEKIRGQPASNPGTCQPDPKGKKLKNLTFLGKIFLIQTQTRTHH